MPASFIPLVHAANHPISSVGGALTDSAGVCVCNDFLLCVVVSTLAYFEWNRKTLYIKLVVLKVSRHWL